MESVCIQFIAVCQCLSKNFSVSALLLRFLELSKSIFALFYPLHCAVSLSTATFAFLVLVQAGQCLVVIATCFALDYRETVVSDVKMDKE